MSIVQRTATGLSALGLATELLQRVRLAHPTAGVWEAADLQWWWRSPRASDDVEQLFWFDDRGPIAAVRLTEWRDGWGLDPIIVPGVPRPTLEDVWRSAMARIHELSLGRVETMVRDDEAELIALVRAWGFEPTEDTDGTTWMDASERPTVPGLPAGFELHDRSQPDGTPHPLVVRHGPGVEARLHECSLYDPGLDLSIRAPSGDVAAYGLFWFDPVTRVGLVEPMRTEDRWQRRGLARTLLAAGLDRLAERGATRMKVSFIAEPARNLYLGAGFRLESRTTTYARQSPAEP